MQKRYLSILFIVLTLAACNTTPNRQARPEAIRSVNNTALTSAQQPTAQAIEQAPPAQEAASTTRPVHADVWKRIGTKLSLDRNLQQASVKQKLAWFRRKQAYLDRVSERAGPYLYFIVEQLEKRQMPLDLALLPIVESAYHPFAYSPSHASGIWQFIPATGKAYGLKQNWWYDGRRDIIASTHAALDYLEKLHAEFKGDWLLALAAYNTGERNVARAIKRNQSAGKKTDFWSLRLPRETRNYVPSLLAVAELIAQPQQHQVEWPRIANQPYLALINNNEQLDLAIVAKLAELSLEEVYTLNPGFNRWATPPAGPHQIVIPIEKKDLFEQGLARLSAKDKVSWRRHIIQRGETLGQIAANHQINLNTLKQTNNLRSDLIHTGHSTWNRISARSLLRPGQKLSLWFADKGKARLRPASLKQWNNISKNKHLQPGQELTLKTRPAQGA